MNPLLELREAGQSVWLDFLRRGLITGGGLERLIEEDGLSGVTSNPSIFRKAISGSTDYDQPVRALVEKGTTDVREIFYDIALEDIQMAADLFRPQFEESGSARGFVSFELEAAIAHDTDATIQKAQELFARIDRPNVMIKVPGTAEGVPAVEELTAAGVNVNITLLFSVERYVEVARAYIAGLEKRLAAGQPVDLPASVASFFVSRVDSAVDEDLAALLATIEEKVKASNASVPRPSLGAVERAVDARLTAAGKERAVARIWRHGHTLWKPDPTEITDRLGWLTVMDAMLEQV